MESGCKHKIPLNPHSTLHSPKLQHYWILTIRLFRIISRTLIRGCSYPSAEKQSVYSTAPADWALWYLNRMKTFLNLKFLEENSTSNVNIKSKSFRAFNPLISLEITLVLYGNRYLSLKQGTVTLTSPITG